MPSIKTLLEQTCKETSKDKESILLCARAYDVLLNSALNLFGLERRIVGFSKNEVENTLKKIAIALSDLENLERKGVFCDRNQEAPIARAVVDNIIKEMKKVMAVNYRLQVQWKPMLPMESRKI